MAAFSIAGAGAIGASIATLLHRAGVEVEFLGRDGDEPTREVKVLLPSGERVEWTCPNRTPGSELQTVARLVVATKAAAVADVLAVWRGQRTYFLQNGRGFVPKGIRGYSLVNTGLSASRHDGVVHLSSQEPMWIGSDTLPEPSDDLIVLASAGIKVRWCDDIDRRRWEKVAINAIINPMTVLAGTTNGATFESAAARSRAAAILGEIATLFEAMHVELSLEALTDSFERVLAVTQSNTSSMLQDFNRGNANSELPFITGALERAAEPLGVAMVETQRLARETEARFGALA
jgi:2-dehydropantoate 2-reductase